MIPTESDIQALWEKYRLPEPKRTHVIKVSQLAMKFAQKIPVNKPLLLSAALLHDIDKNVSPLQGEIHPDTAVRILREEGLEEVADVVVTHPLHAILDPRISPKTWEQKLLYLADKMVKYDIVGVDERFRLWNSEPLDAQAKSILRDAYPLVKKLEQEVFTLANIGPSDLY